MMATAKELTLMQDLDIEKRSCASRQFANAQRQNITRQDDETALGLEMTDPRAGPETTFLQGEWNQILYEDMDQLTPRTRTAIELRELGELSTKEAARVMGLSVGGVKARVFHGRRKLRRLLKRESAWTSGKRSLRASRKANGLSRNQLVCSFGT